MRDGFSERLNGAFPRTAWPIIVRGLGEGIGLADDVRKNTPFLSNLAGKDLRGHIRRAGIMFRLDQMCRHGDLPFTAKMGPMPVGSWHWLNIYAPGVIAHLARTDEPADLPEDTKNRQPQRARNQYELYEDRRVIYPAEFNELYAFITFGATRHGDLTHAVIGLPCSDNQGWLARENILDASREAGFVPSRPTPPDPLDRTRFREHVESVLRDQDVDDSSQSE